VTSQSQPRSLDSIDGGISGDELLAFRDALVTAYPRWQDLREFAEGNDLVEDLEAEIGGPTKATNDVAYDLLKAMKKQGHLDFTLDKALARRRSSSVKLLRYARSMGRKVRLGIYEDLSLETFDLQHQETTWRQAFGATLTKRIIVFVIREADQEVLDPLVRRLHRYLEDHSQTSAFGAQPLTLSAAIASLNEAITRVKRFATILDEKPVLLRVYAERAVDPVVIRFLDGVKQHFTNGLRQHLVMIMNVCASCAPAPHEFVELPIWSYEEAELNLWILSIARRSGWTDDFAAEFKTYIRDRASYAGAAPTPGVLYDTLAQVVDFLQTEPSTEAVRAWLMRTD
jgi:hypothetical protein